MCDNNHIDSSSANDYLTNLLESFNQEYKVVSSNFVNKENFSIIFHTKLPKADSPSRSCDVWKETFSQKTNTDWTVRETFPTPLNYVYRKKYTCQHSSHNKSVLVLKSERYSKYRNKHCNATIDIKISKITKNTKKKHSYIRDGLNTTIKVVFEHSHNTENAEAYSYLRMGKETEEQFLEYFHNGMTAATAKAHHELNIMDNTDDLQEIAKILANAKLNPLDTQVNGLYSKFRKGEFGGRSNSSVYMKLKEKQEEYAAKGVEMLILEEPLTVAMITPLMRRAHSISGISDIVFTDSSGSCDQTSTVTTFMFGSTKVGGIPLGVVLHTGQSEENYSIAFSLLKKLLGPTSFNNKGEPSVIMTDDSKAERNALKTVFPAAVLLLCFFHILQALWRWLFDSKNNIKKDHRPYLLRIVKSIMYAPSEIECSVEKLQFEMDSIVCQYPNFKLHVEKLLEREKEWCLCFRASLPTKGHNTNNIVESSIRIFKDCVLLRSKAFNMVALIHFTSLSLENYHIRRLLSYAGYRRSKNYLMYNALINKAKDLTAIKVSEHEYHVNSASHSNMKYQVFSDIEQCTCYEGNGGKFCKHLCAVKQQFNLEFSNSPQLASQDKLDLVKLALGSKDIDKEFYMSMDNVEASTSHQSLDVEMTLNDTSIISNSQTENNLESGSILHDPNPMPQDESEQKNVLIQELNTHLERITKLSSSASNSNIKKLNSHLKQIQTESQFADFCNNKLISFRQGKKINVQPTAQSRRKKRPGLSCGSLRIQAGRPANDETPTVKKRKRDLSLSVAKNYAHAKSHGRNH